LKIPLIQETPPTSSLNIIEYYILTNMELDAYIDDVKWSEIEGSLLIEKNG
jgi:hypothetical protein